MQRIKLDVFKGFFEKKLTGNEIDFIITLSHLQDDRGIVCGVYYREMMQETGMSAQAFYDCKKSLEEKGIIHIKKVLNDYDITLIGNDFSQYTDADYQTGGVSYVKTNCKMFSDCNWKKLKPAQKLLAMDLLNINKASQGRTHKIGREKFIQKYANTVTDGTMQKGLLDVGERTLLKYMKLLKLYFHICIKDGMYLITLRSHYSAIETMSENNVTYDRMLGVAARRNKIEGKEEKEAKGILELLCIYKKNLLQLAVYIPDIFVRMLEVINTNIMNRRKWKRYFKKSLFHKLLKEEFLIL